MGLVHFKIGSGWSTIDGPGSFAALEGIRFRLLARKREELRRTRLVVGRAGRLGRNALGRSRLCRDGEEQQQDRRKTHRLVDLPKARARQDVIVGQVTDQDG